MEKSDIEAFAKLALAEKPEGKEFDPQLASDYLRLQTTSTPSGEFFRSKDVNQRRIRKVSLFSIMVQPESIVTNNT